MLPAELFQKLVERKALSHAYVFSGNDKEQKTQAFLHFVAKLGIHAADQMEIRPGGKEIPIAEVRRLITFFSMSPWTSPYQVGFIHEAHFMNREAQSALLKLLEEPKGEVIFFLATEYPDLLLDTIRSRCQEWKFYTFGATGISAETQKEFERLRKASLHDRFAFAKKLADAPEQVGQTLAQWVALLRSSMVDAARTDVHAAYAIGQKITIAQEVSHILQTSNASPRLALERLLLDL